MEGVVVKLTEAFPQQQQLAINTGFFKYIYEITSNSASQHVIIQSH